MKAGILITITLLIVGCNSTPYKYNNEIRSKSSKLIKLYMEAANCNDIQNREVIATMPSSDDTFKEHWRIKACGKIYNLALTVSKDGDEVSINNL
tara:strand:+ start:456 stop:740 length:285 start_codon:yes stop_codon:yes gene_type:complete